MKCQSKKVFSQQFQEKINDIIKIPYRTVPYKNKNVPRFILLQRMYRTVWYKYPSENKNIEKYYYYGTVLY